MILFWKILFGALSLSCFAGFAWAIKKHFCTVGKGFDMPAGMRVVSLLGLLFMISQLIAVATTTEFNFWAAIAGALFYILSFTLFWWAIAATRQKRLTLAFSEDAPEHLLASGPYRFVRHPFYAAYIFFWLAGLIATLQWWLFISVVAMTVLYFRAARMEENKFAITRLNAEYLSYRERTGMFLPKFPVRRIVEKQTKNSRNISVERSK